MTHLQVFVTNLSRSRELLLECLSHILASVAGNLQNLCHENGGWFVWLGGYDVSHGILSSNQKGCIGHTV